MKYFIPNEMQPSEKTLQIIKQFARQYKPHTDPAWLLKGITFGIA